MLIDSVDEIPFRCRGHFLDSLARLIASGDYAVGRYVITSRSLGGAEEAAVDRLCGEGPRAEFAPFDETRQRRLFSILNDAYGGAVAAGFDAIRRTPGFDALMGNPGMLAAIVEELKKPGSDASGGTLANQCLANIERILPKTGGAIPSCDRVAIAHLAYDAIVADRMRFADGVECRAANGQGEFVRSRFLELFNRYREQDGGDRAQSEEALDRTISRCGIFRESADTIRFEYEGIKAYFAAIWLCRQLDGGADPAVVDRFLAGNGHESVAVVVAALCVFQRIEVAGGDSSALRGFYRHVVLSAFARDDYRQTSGVVGAANAQQVLRLMPVFDFGGPVRQPEPVRTWRAGLDRFLAVAARGAGVGVGAVAGGVGATAGGVGGIGVAGGGITGAPGPVTGVGMPGPLTGVGASGPVTGVGMPGGVTTAVAPGNAAGIGVPDPITGVGTPGIATRLGALGPAVGFGVPDAATGIGTSGPVTAFGAPSGTSAFGAPCGGGSYGGDPYDGGTVGNGPYGDPHGGPYAGDRYGNDPGAVDPRGGDPPDSPDFPHDGPSYYDGMIIR